MIAFFVGKIWSPSFPYTNAINTLPDQQTVVFGNVPFATGAYLVHLEVQIGWNGNTAANANGTYSLYCGDITNLANQIRQIQWGSLKVGGDGYDYGTVQSYSHWFICPVLTQGQPLTLKVASNMFVIGAQCAVFIVPPYVI